MQNKNIKISLWITLFIRESQGSDEITFDLQAYISCLTFTTFVMVAACKGFVAFQIPQLQHDNSTIKITDEEASWIGKLHSFIFTNYDFSNFPNERNGA